MKCNDFVALHACNAVVLCPRARLYTFKEQAWYLYACNHNIKEHNERIPEGLTSFPLERLLDGY